MSNVRSRGVQSNKKSWLRQHLTTILSSAAVITLLISSIVIIPRAIATHAGPNSGPNAHYVPSSAFGDTDDLPNGALKAPRLTLAAGSASVSGVVTDANTGKPVASAQVGISTGVVGGGGQYTTTASDGSYSFTSIASGTYNLAADRYTISRTQPFYKDTQQMKVTVNAMVTVNFSLIPIPA